jgi:hypothetical protein
MASSSDAGRGRLTTLTAGAILAAVALGATAAAGLPDHDKAAPVAASPAAPAAAGAAAPASTEEYPFFDATSLFEEVEPLPGEVQDKAVPTIPQATRSATRAVVHPAIPPKTSEKPECLLDLGYGTWAIDVTAARALTMYAAVGYRQARKVLKPARAWQKNMHTQGRLAPTPDEALEGMRRKYDVWKPRQLYVDAIHAMYKPHSLTCAVPFREMPWQPMLTNGLTFRSQELLFAWWEAYGGRPVGGFSPEGITTGHIEDSAHYDARAVDISFSLDDPANKLRGWLLAHWLVAHADYYQIATIIWDGLIWSNYRSTEGWRKYEHPWGPTKSPTLLHHDHIHVDVVKGWSPDMPVAADDKAADDKNAGKAAAKKNDAVARKNAPKADPRVGGAD